MTKSYAGIGSRKTPENLQRRIHSIAFALDKRGYTLRSGGAPGADTFFEVAARHVEVYLPWKGFNNRPKNHVSEHRRFYQSPTDDAIALAQSRIDGYDRRPHPARMLLARNMHQVLGYDLNDPVEFVICWTYHGRVAGGTAHAIRLATSMGITVYNLANIADSIAVDRLLGWGEQKEMFEDEGYEK